VLSGESLERAERAAGQRVHLHRIAGGHWVNADNPDALLDLLIEWLPAN
jgi:pimeloyl-ACP methyl ester carboxylesterase